MKRFKNGLLILTTMIVLVAAICIYFNLFESDGSGLVASKENLISAFILLILMIVDFLFGLVNAIFFKKSKKTKHGGLASGKGIEGLIKKSLILILIFTIWLLESSFLEGYHLFATTVVGFSLMEFISILENLMLMGVPFPKKLKAFFEIMKEKDEKEKEKEEEKKKEERGEENNEHTSKHS